MVQNVKPSQPHTFGHGTLSLKKAVFISWGCHKKITTNLVV